MKNVFLFLTLFFTINVSAQPGKKKTSVGKMYFSNQPFGENHDGAKTQFNSNEFIYGRLETSSKKFYELFRLTEADKIIEGWWLYYVISIYKNGRQVNWSSMKVWSLKNINWNISALNFDILPHPAKASTEIIDPNKTATLNSSEPGGLYEMIDENHFPENGTYQIRVEIYDEIKNEWGKLEPYSAWPSFEAEFDFTFSNADIAMLKQNHEAAKLPFYKKNVAAKEEKQKAKMIANDEYNATKKIADDKAAELHDLEVKKRGDEIRQAYKKEAAEKLAQKEMPEGWTAKSQPLNGPFTVAYIKEAFKNQNPGATFYKIYIGPDEGWQVIKNNFGIPRYMQTDRYLQVFAKDADGDCGYWPFYFKKEYLGGGKYGKPYLSFSGIELLPCNKMK